MPRLRGAPLRSFSKAKTPLGTLFTGPVAERLTKRTVIRDKNGLIVGGGYTTERSHADLMKIVEERAKKTGETINIMTQDLPKEKTGKTLGWTPKYGANYDKIFKSKKKSNGSK
ncbi:Uncharacterised protein [uncultured archaeon]|nr:Uncharacterised protein [uncultured archaeon]